MAGRSRMPPHGLHDAPPPHFSGRGPPHHHPPPGLLEDGRAPALGPRGVLGGGGGGGGHHGPLPPFHPAVIEERLAAQHQDVQILLADNQRVAATHVALKQELAAVQHEIRRSSHALAAFQADKDLQLREIYDKSMKLESELRAVEAMKEELIRVRGDIQKLNAQKQELTGQVQAMTRDLTQTNNELQQVPAIKAEIETMKQEIQRVRTAIDYEKKGYAENYEQGQEIEKNLVSMAREVEKLRAEIGNAEKRARAAVAAGNQGYVGSFGNPEPMYNANPYPAGYAMNHVPGSAEALGQYGSAPQPGSWGAYDMQRAQQGRR